MMPTMKEIFESSVVGGGRTSSAGAAFIKQKEDPDSLMIKDLISAKDPEEDQKGKKWDAQSQLMLR